MVPTRRPSNIQTITRRTTKYMHTRKTEYQYFSQQRRNLKDKYNTNAIQLRQSNKETAKGIRRDIRKYYTEEIKKQ